MFSSKTSLSRALAATVGLSIAPILSSCATRDTSGLDREVCTRRPSDTACCGFDCKGDYFEVLIPATAYEAERARVPILRWALHAFEPAPFITPDHPVIQELARKLTCGAKSPEEMAHQILSWVGRSIVYDELEARPLHDYARTPVETLAERRGDCDDVADLIISLCLAVGLPAMRGCYPPDHITCAIAGDFTGDYIEAHGRRYFIAEPKFGSQVSMVGDSGVDPLRMATIRHFFEPRR